ncbi:hypothetical protein [Rhizobium grahamii]|uniref:Transmembrane protein n=1 Tax=Rhizobium grahamii CCGE 502 TaxID=990285 RepID=S3IBV1_9HYPH|nr:hypothetical protein [Rhizobium grahamii]EPE96683.1 hypothetical protein RGCCGE502_18655 [Rhizobium grahamii CCGE 502]
MFYSHVRTSLLAVVLYGAVGIALIQPDLSTEAKALIALVVLAALLALVVLTMEPALVNPTQSSEPPPAATLTPNEIATLLWLMRRGKQRFTETSESIWLMHQKGVVVRPWQQCDAWMISGKMWDKRDAFMSSRLLLYTPDKFPANGAFL